MIKQYVISIPKKYTKNGEEKTTWNNVGKMVKFEATTEKPEGFIIELHMFPNTTFKVFEDKKVEAVKSPKTSEKQEDVEFPF